MSNQKLTPGLIFEKHLEAEEKRKEKDYKFCTSIQPEEYFRVNEQYLSIAPLYAEMCKRSFYFFTKCFFNIATGVPMIDNWHIKYLCDVAQEIFFNCLHGKPAIDTLINICPGSTKSVLLSQLFPCYIHAVRPDLIVLTGSCTYDLAERQSSKSLRVMTSKKYMDYFPMTRLRRTATSEYETTLGGSRFICSPGSSVIGKHATAALIIDDAEDFKMVQSNAERLKVQNWLKGDLSLRKANKYTIPTIYIQQRLSFQDSSSFLLQNDDTIRHICLPADISEPHVAALVKPQALRQFYVDNLMDVKRLNRDAFPKILRDLNNSNLRFQTEINQNPTDETDSEVKRSWFKVVSPLEFAEIIKGGHKVNFYADLAFTDNSKNGKNDPSVFLAVTTVNKHMYVVGLYRDFKEFPDLVTDLQDFVKKYGYTNNSKIFIEPKASGQSAYQWLKKQTTLNVYEYTAPKDSKRNRTTACTGTWENGRVLLVEHASQNEQLLGEVCQPYLTKKYWDITDTLTMATENEIISKGISNVPASDRYS